MPTCATYRPQQLPTARHCGGVGVYSESRGRTYEYNYSTKQIAYIQCYSTSSEPSLIHMNGRAYAPGLQRFLSPDPVLQAPANAQSHNRYAYCLNNPLRYTDPSGYQVAPLAQAIDNWMEMMRSLHRDVDMAIHCAVAGGWYLSGTVDGRKHFQGLFWETEVNRSTNSGGGGNSSGWEWTPRGYGGMGRTANGGHGGGFERGGHGGGGGGRGGRTGGGLRLLDRIDDANGIISPVTGWLNLIGAAAEAGNAGHVAKTAADLQVEKILGKVGKVGKGLGWAGVGLSVGINLVNLFNDFTPGNMAKLLMSGAIAATGLIPYAGPIISLGLTAYELDGGFDDFYKWIDLQFNEP